MASFVGGRSGEPLKGEIIELEEIADSGEGSGRGTGQHELILARSDKLGARGLPIARGHEFEFSQRASFC
ncbi:hypothetical protein CsSME_00052184 [Camellia sinensis var. sinensis]